MGDIIELHERVKMIEYYIQQQIDKDEQQQEKDKFTKKVAD